MRLIELNKLNKSNNNNNKFTRQKINHKHFRYHGGATTLTDIKRMDTKARKRLTYHRIHHPKTDVDRLYLFRSEGDRG